MPAIGLSIKPTLRDKDWVCELFYQMPIIERFAPVFKEVLWVLSGASNGDQHAKVLPEYGCNILDVYRRITFKAVPLLADTVQVMNSAALPEAKTLDAAKKVVRFDWQNLGRLSAIGTRCIRFAELEAEAVAHKDGWGQESPESAQELFTIIFGRQWVRQNAGRISATPADKLFAELLNEFIAARVAEFIRIETQLDALAYQWSAEAMIEFKQGYAEGMTVFLDASGQLKEESERAGTYIVLLLAWPEIKAMQESRPRKTLTHLHGWLKPFMRLGIMPMLDIDSFRDVCAPPKQGGIGLSLRPLKTRRSSA